MVPGTELQLVLLFSLGRPWPLLIPLLRFHSCFQVMSGYLFDQVSADHPTRNYTVPHPFLSQLFIRVGADPLVGTEHVQINKPQGAFYPVEEKQIDASVNNFKQKRSIRRETSPRGVQRRDQFLLAEKSRQASWRRWHCTTRFIAGRGAHSK